MIPDKVGDELENNETLAQRAYNTLGYKGLTYQSDTQKFLSFLKERKYEVFSEERMKKYQAVRIRHNIGIGISTFRSWTAFALLLSFVISLVLMSAVNLDEVISNLLILVCFISFGLCLPIGVYELESRGRYEWLRISLEDYIPLVPDETLGMAIDIKTAFPEAIFVVHHLKQRSSRNLLRDALLEVEFSDVSYFLAAWECQESEDQGLLG